MEMGWWFLKNRIRKNVTFHKTDIRLIKDGQESIQSSTTPDPGYQWESNKVTV